MMNGIKINFETREIKVTKRFMDAASMLQSEEFIVLARLHRELPDFEISRNRNHRQTRNFAV